MRSAKSYRQENTRAKAQSQGGEPRRAVPAQQKDVCCSNPLRRGEHPPNPSHSPEKTLQTP